VIHIDKRILDIESPAQEVIASDYKRLVVDAFARYKITKPLLFYQTVGSVEGGNCAPPDAVELVAAACARRGHADAGRARSARELMAKVRTQVEAEAQGLRHHVVDVRIRRADLPEQNSLAIYQRMQPSGSRSGAIPRRGQPALAGDPCQG
jgi:membrane protease subunit HflC